MKWYNKFYTKPKHWKYRLLRIFFKPLPLFYEINLETYDYMHIGEDKQINVCHKYYEGLREKHEI